MKSFGGAAPFVVTLGLDAALQETMARARARHFPPERNLVPAHVSLFHQLPGEAEEEVLATLAAVCGSTAPFPVEVTGVMSLGRGTAYRLAADGRLHARLARAWDGMLTAQDRQAWRPHVTIQNKVDPAAARGLQAELTAGFVPFGGWAESVRLWRYLAGPWEEEGVFPLTG